MCGKCHSRNFMTLFQLNNYMVGFNYSSKSYQMIVNGSNNAFYAMLHIFYYNKKSYVIIS